MGHPEKSGLHGEKRSSRFPNRSDTKQNKMCKGSNDLFQEKEEELNYLFNDNIDTEKQLQFLCSFFASFAFAYVPKPGFVIAGLA